MRGSYFLSEVSENRYLLNPFLFFLFLLTSTSFLSSFLNDCTCASLRFILCCLTHFFFLTSTILNLSVASLLLLTSPSNAYQRPLLMLFWEFCWRHRRSLSMCCFHWPVTIWCECRLLHLLFFLKGFVVSSEVLSVHFVKRIHLFLIATNSCF